MPIMALANPPVESAAVLLPILVVQDVVSVWSFRKSWDRTVLLVMLPGMMTGVVLGYLFAARVSERAVLAMVGGLSVLFGLQRLWHERGRAPCCPPIRRAGWACCSASARALAVRWRMPGRRRSRCGCCRAACRETRSWAPPRSALPL
jgi:uncharacterized membrane protein YfcA